nr:hypothetical protein [Rhodococcus sp. (in: high G+C Gram-positive bacteria)]
MSDHLQTSIDTAWALYTNELSDFVASMPCGQSLRIVAESGIDRGDGDSPWILLHSGSDDIIDSSAVLDSYLYADDEAGAGDDHLLVALGWTAPAARTEQGKLISRSMQTQRRGSRLLATQIVRAFREGWRVTHPAFLTSVSDGDIGREFRTATDRQLPDTTAVFPADMDHLRALILDSLGTSSLFIDRSVEENGDIRIDNFALPVHICFGHDASAVRLHAPLVTGVKISAALSHTLSRWTTKWKNISFVVAGDQLFAGIVVDTRTYIPRHLTSMTYRLGMFVDELDAAFAAEFGGTVFDPTHRHEEPRPKVNWSDDSGTL